MIIFFRCDPDKNKECKKRSCAFKRKAYRCKCTSNADYAVKDVNGQPIVAFIHFDNEPPVLVDGGDDY